MSAHSCRATDCEDSPAVVNSPSKLTVYKNILQISVVNVWTGLGQRRAGKPGWRGNRYPPEGTRDNDRFWFAVGTGEGGDARRRDQGNAARTRDRNPQEGDDGKTLPSPCPSCVSFVTPQIETIAKCADDRTSLTLSTV